MSPTVEPAPSNHPSLAIEDTVPFPVHSMFFQVGMSKLSGLLYLGEHALYFVKSHEKSAIAGLFGPDLGLGQRSQYERKPRHTEEDLRVAAIESGGFVLVPSKIHIIKQTLFLRQIKYEGMTIGAVDGFDKEVRRDLGAWAREHGVKSKGMK